MNGRLICDVGRITGVTAEETRERLLRAGAAMFQARGFEGTRVADIAREAGVSNGALYSHFGSKAELLAEALVASRRDREVATAMGGHLRERDDWLVEIIRQGQATGTVAPDLSPDAVSRYCLMLLLGSILLPAAGLPPVDGDDWAVLIERLGEALKPVGADVHRPEPSHGGTS